MNQAWRALADDPKVLWVILLLAADFLLGVVAAFRRGTFRASYLADFLRNDVVKVFGWSILYTLDFLAPEDDVTGQAISVAEIGAYTVLLGAMLASVLNSVREISGPAGEQSLKDAIAGDEKPPPGP